MPTDPLRDFDKLPNSAMVPDTVVSAVFGISRPTVWRWVKEGRLPQPVKLGPNTTRFNVGKLRQQIELWNSGFTIRMLTTDSIPGTTKSKKGRRANG